MRDLLDSMPGRVSAIVLAVIGVGGAIYAVWHNIGRTDAAAAAQDRVFVCAETGKSFRHRLSVSDRIPIVSPRSGKRTGYPAELCYWTASGQTRREPVPVLLNFYCGRSEPTFCPNCGRLVVSHNPAPDPSRKPPPTRSEYQARMPMGQGRHD
jgi:hypothetical protein